MRSRAYDIALTVSACALAWSPLGVARAYRTYADDPEVRYPARWHASRQVWELSTPGIDSSGLEAEEIEVALASASRVASMAPCSNALPAPEYGGRTPSMPVSGDGRNTIAFLPRWGDLGSLPSRGATSEIVIETDAGGIARIVEADMYLNLEDFQFSVDGAEGSLDLESVAAHEWLHWLGFLHVCEHSDSLGSPSCSGDPAFMQSALYPDYLGSRARTPSADDLAGVCAVYSPSSAPCDPGCDASQRCEAGACVPLPPSVCSTDAECDVAGDGSLRCAAHGAETDMCIPAGELWTACSTSMDCMSGLCATSMSAMTSFCTVSCATNADCPPELVCGQASGVDVCRPPVIGTCSSSPGIRPRSTWTWAAVLSAFIAMRPRRRGARERT